MNLWNARTNFQGGSSLVKKIKIFQAIECVPRLVKKFQSVYQMDMWKFQLDMWELFRWYLVKIKNFLWTHISYRGINLSYFIEFFMISRGSQTCLFYSKLKVWIIPKILSPFLASYDKNLAFLVWPKVCKRTSFHLISKRFDLFLHVTTKRTFSMPTLKEATGTSFCHVKLKRAQNFRSDPCYLFWV